MSVDGTVNHSAIRTTGVFCSLASLPLIMMGLMAPFLLMIGAIWLVAIGWSSAIKKRLDGLGLVIVLGCFGSVVGVCFVPLWIAEFTTRTPDDFVELAEGFRRRGQILGNRGKARTYYLRAAEAGSVEAQARVAEDLYFGHYGMTHREDGIKWLRLAASNGHDHSRQLLRSIEAK